MLEVLKVLHEAENCHSSVHLFMKQNKHLPKAGSESVAMFNRYAWDLECNFIVQLWHSVTTLKIRRGKKNMRLNDYNNCKICNQILYFLIFIIYTTLWKFGLVTGFFFLFIFFLDKPLSSISSFSTDCAGMADSCMDLESYPVLNIP